MSTYQWDPAVAAGGYYPQYAAPAYAQPGAAAAGVVDPTAAPHAQGRRLGAFAIGMLFVIGLVWGAGTGFSYSGTDSSNPAGGLGAAYMMFAALLTAVVGVSLINPGALFAWVTNRVGVLLAAHIGFALVVGLLFKSPHLALIRYALLVPAMSMMLGVAMLGRLPTSALRAGLTAGGLCVVLYVLTSVDLGRISDPYYRVKSFLNPNSLGFVAGMTAISLLDFVLGGTRSRRVGPGGAAAKLSWARLAGRGILTCFVLACLIVCVATKSRTATAAMLCGMMVRLYLSLGLWKALGITLAAGLAGLLFQGGVTSMGDRVIEVFQLKDRVRGVANATGRVDTWKRTVEHVWVPNMFLGVGPGRANDTVEQFTGQANAHNGVLHLLCETGVIGAVPVLIILWLCARAAWRRRRDPTARFAIALFAAAMVESLAEALLFGMGNPGSLLFLLSVASLTAPGSETAAAAAAAQSGMGYGADYNAGYAYDQYGMPAAVAGNGNGYAPYG